MAALAISNPIFSTGFLGQKLSNRLSAKATVVRIPRCATEGNVPEFTSVNGIPPWVHRRKKLRPKKQAGHFQNRKEEKINSKSRLVEESPPWLKRLLNNFVDLPPTDVIFRRLLPFAFIGHWNITNTWPETLVDRLIYAGGGGWHIVLSFAACIYFLNKKTRSLCRALFIGLAMQEIGFACASVVVPRLLKVLLRPTWTPGLLTSLVVQVFFLLGCTFLK